MRAAVVPAFGAPLEIRDVERPRPGAGQVLVKIEASGLCHTDIHAAHGDWPVKPKLPLIPGHEGVGRVVEVGESVDTLAVGDRVALPWLALACGRCRYCIAGRETYCQSPQYMGYTIDGGYAEYAVGYASHVVRVPDAVSSIDAAPITCAPTDFAFSQIFFASWMYPDTKMTCEIGTHTVCSSMASHMASTSTVMPSFDSTMCTLALPAAAISSVVPSAGRIFGSAPASTSTSSITEAIVACPADDRFVVLVGSPSDSTLPPPSPPWRNFQRRFRHSAHSLPSVWLPHAHFRCTSSPLISCSIS